MKPFDLQKAMAGDPLVTRDGRAARFIVYVPELDKNCRVIVRVNDDPRVKDFSEEGRYWGESAPSPLDLFMAPKKRTVWLNFWKDNGLKCTVFESEDGAKGTPGYHPWTHIAVPIEIED